MKLLTNSESELTFLSMNWRPFSRFGHTPKTNGIPFGERGQFGLFGLLLGHQSALLE